MNINKNNKIKVIDLGCLEYQESLNIQQDYFNSILEIKQINKNIITDKGITPNYLIFTSHLPVYTLGKNGNSENILISKKKLEELGATYFLTNRGGDVTFHGNGQIVVYPILDLDNFSTDLHKYMRCLEEVIIRVVSDYGLNAERSKGETGVWLDVGKSYPRKICAIGVKVSRWVTMHGLSLNVNTDLKYFDYIIPCGIKGKGVTSLEKELGKKVDLDETKEKIKYYFKKVFEIEWI